MEKIEQRSFLKYVIFNFLTAGIYGMYIYYCLGRDINTMCEGDGKVTPNYLIAKVLGTATLGLYYKYWLYQQGQRLHVNAPRYGYKTVEDGWHVLGLSLLPGVSLLSSYVLIKNVNQMAANYNRTVTA